MGGSLAGIVNPAGACTPHNRRQGLQPHLQTENSLLYLPLCCNMFDGGIHTISSPGMNACGRRVLVNMWVLVKLFPVKQERNTEFCPI